METGADSWMSSMELIQDTGSLEPAGQDIEDSSTYCLLMFSSEKMIMKGNDKCLYLNYLHIGGQDLS